MAVRCCHRQDTVDRARPLRLLVGGGGLFQLDHFRLEICSGEKNVPLSFLQIRLLQSPQTNRFGSLLRGSKSRIHRDPWGYLCGENVVNLCSLRLPDYDGAVP